MSSLTDLTPLIAYQEDVGQLCKIVEEVEI